MSLGKLPITQNLTIKNEKFYHEKREGRKNTYFTKAAQEIVHRALQNRHLKIKGKRGFWALVW
jgi:hypothetical protein